MKRKKLKIIDINRFTGGVWKDEYIKRLITGELFIPVKNDNSINFIEKEVFGKEIYTY